MTNQSKGKRNPPLSLQISAAPPRISAGWRRKNRGKILERGNGGALLPIEIESRGTNEALCEVYLRQTHEQSRTGTRNGSSSKGKKKSVLSLSQVSHGEDVQSCQKKRGEQAGGKKISSLFYLSIRCGATSWPRKRTGFWRRG